MPRPFASPFVLVALVVVPSAAQEVDGLAPEDDLPGVAAPGVLETISIDFEQVDERGPYPYHFSVSGDGRIGAPDPADLVFSGSKCLVLEKEGVTVLQFDVLAERVSFRWRDENELVKATAIAYDDAGQVVAHESAGHDDWAYFDHDDGLRAIRRIVFTRQSADYVAAVDDLVYQPIEPAQPFCFAYGSSEVCPCGNPAAAGSLQGCENSTGRGARMHALGSSDAEAADLRFHLTGLPAGAPAMLLEGSQAGVQWPFRDGMLCIGDLRRRLDVGFSDANGRAVLGSEVFVGHQAPRATQSFDYQVWYRDSGDGSVCGTGSSFSQAQRVVFD